MGHQAQERAYRPEEPKGSPPPPRRSLYPAAAVRRVSTDARGRSNEIKTLPMIRIRLASAPGRCYISAAVCTPAGEVAPRRVESAAPKEQPPRKLSGKRTAGAKGALESGGPDEQSRPLTEGVSRGRPLARAGGAVNLSGSRTEGASPGRASRPLCRRCARVPVQPLDGAAAAHAALRSASRARRPHGAVRRLRDAGAVPGRHHRRASAHPRARPACSTSRIWARSRLRGDERGAGARGAGPGRSAGLAPRRMRYTLLLNEPAASSTI